MKLKLLTTLILLPFFSMAQTALENGQAFLQDFFSQKYDQAVTYFDPSVQSAVTPALLKQTAETLSQKLGSYKKVLDKTGAKDQNHEVWYFYTAFDKASLDLKLVFSKSNKLIGFTLVPHKEIIDKDSAEHPDSTTYSILSGDMELPGTLLIADAGNQKKLVVLIHGSGPNDRDETVGPIKPFKDLAEGLLTYGISSYRFDKRTKVAPKSFAKNYTIDNEVTNDAVNIIRYFHDNDTFRNYKIYVIGHSLGAYMAPKIASRTKGQITGIVMLAASARPMEDVLQGQYEYLDSLQPSQALESIITKLGQQIDYLHSPSFTLSSPADSLPMNQPATYWMSLKGYDPLKLISKTDNPYLILQGEKDYQVLMEDFHLWENATKGNPKMTFKSYPGLFHAFMISKGTPGPQDYNTAQHIPGYVIEDIAHWILKNG